MDDLFPENIEYGEEIELEFEEIHSYNTTSHDDLIHKDLPDQHPISSITGLLQKLEDLAAIADKSYVHTQRTAASTWDIVHNLHKYPSVTIVDSANTTVIGDISYIDTDHLTITFIGTFSGKAYLN